MAENLKRHLEGLFGDYSLRVNKEQRSLTPVELEQVNAAINGLRAGQRTSCYLESPISEGIELIHDHFRIKFGLPRLPIDIGYSGLLEYVWGRNYFAGLNPSWDSREPADVEFMAFGQLGVYDYARAGHLEFP